MEVVKQSVCHISGVLQKQSMENHNVSQLKTRTYCCCSDANNYNHRLLKHSNAFTHNIQQLTYNYVPTYTYLIKFVNNYILILNTVLTGISGPNVDSQKAQIWQITLILKKMSYFFEITKIRKSRLLNVCTIVFFYVFLKLKSLISDTQYKLQNIISKQKELNKQMFVLQILTPLN